MTVIIGKSKVNVPTTWMILILKRNSRALILESSKKNRMSLTLKLKNIRNKSVY